MSTATLGRSKKRVVWSEFGAGRKSECDAQVVWSGYEGCEGMLDRMFAKRATAGGLGPKVEAEEGDEDYGEMEDKERGGEVRVVAGSLRLSQSLGPEERFYRSGLQKRTRGELGVVGVDRRVESGQGDTTRNWTLRSVGLWASENRIGKRQDV